MPLPVNECNFPPRPFVGRQVELHCAFKYFSEGHRCVTLTGARGNGKSALASRLAAHLKPRHLFCHILQLDLSARSEVLAAVRDRQNTLSPLPLPPPPPPEELRRSLCKVVEEALNKTKNMESSTPSPSSPGSASGSDPEELRWSRRLTPSVADLRDLIENLVALCSLRFKRTEQRPLLLVVDGADAWCEPLVEFLNRLFHQCELVRVLSTCCTGLAAAAASQHDAVAERQIKVEPLNATEAAELLVRAAPRPLKASEIGISVSGQQALSWDGALMRLANQQALKKLKGHPRAIKCFVEHLGTLEDSISSGDAGGRSSIDQSASASSSVLLNDLVETAKEC